MQLGLLADIHEEAGRLQAALACFDHEAVEQVIVLGDLVETGLAMESIVRLLEDAGAVGVWGNHDLGLCFEPEPELTAKYPTAINRFMGSLRPWYEHGRYLITHALPTFDPQDPAAYYLSPQPHEPQAREACFTQHPGRVLVMGHYHRWLAATPAGLLPWKGEGPLDLAPHDSLLLVIHAVQQGWCAVLDTDREVLTPHFLGEQERWMGVPPALSGSLL